MSCFALLFRVFPPQIVFYDIYVLLLADIILLLNFCGLQFVAYKSTLTKSIIMTNMDMSKNTSRRYAIKLLYKIIFDYYCSYSIPEEKVKIVVKQNDSTKTKNNFKIIELAEKEHNLYGIFVVDALPSTSCHRLVANGELMTVYVILKQIAKICIEWILCDKHNFYDKMIQRRVIDLKQCESWWNESVLQLLERIG